MSNYHVTVPCVRRCGSEEMVRGSVAHALEAKIVNGSVDRAARQAASTHRPFPSVSSPEIRKSFHHRG
ncbi:hypothetical protein IG631_18479 [Alternaria alternata]|nr:hypothetical protein IG631_18479 [Alternaria alternata]